MSILAYSELLKRITGINEQELEEPFKILSKNNTTKTRLKIIRGLATHEPISIGNLLHKINLPRGGGSYITARKYFMMLERDGLLEKEKRKSRTVWKFSQKGTYLKRYILS